MNSRELVKAAIRHEDTERVPYYIRFTRKCREMLIEEHGIENPDAWMDNDVIGVGAPWWGWHQLGPDWRQPATPTSPATVIGRGSYEGFVENVKRLRDTTDKYILVTIYGSHFEKANAARSIENFLADMAADYAFAKKLCDTIIEKNMVMLENFLMLDEIDGVLLGSDWGSQRGLLMSPTTWDDLIRPGEQREYDLVHSYGKDLWVHSCGDVQTLIPRLIDMGLDVLNPVQPECMDVEMLKREYGDKLTWWGGLSTQQTLPFGTAEDVKAESLALKKMMGANGGLIFSPAQEIQTDVPFTNIEMLREVAGMKG